MHTPTLEALLAEAKKNQKRAAALFDKCDNSDDMHDEETWTSVVEWLEGKL